MNRLISMLAAFVVAALVIPAPASAQAGQLFDHLKCYPVNFKKDQLVISDHAHEQFVFTPFQIPPFSVEDGCTLLPARNPRPFFFCIPVDKQKRQDPVGKELANDFFLYKARCPSQDDFDLRIRDQFVEGTAMVHRKTPLRLIEVPAFKLLPPPQECGFTGPHMCGGPCPKATDVCQIKSDDSGCECVSPPPPPCGVDATGQCGGACPNTTDKCEIRFDPASNTDKCACWPTVDTCTAGAAIGQCGGSCVDPTKSCKPVLGTTTCRCQ